MYKRQDLYRENVLLATHADINDEGQTIKVKNPEIGTTASFEGEKEIDPLDKVTLTDTVSYKDLTPGKEYRVTGVLMDKSNGKELLIPVKSKEPIPRKIMTEAMKEIQEIEVNAPVKMGDVIKENLAGSGVELVACKTVK